ncbi:Chaperone protein dnaJ 11 [Spatholobus suberectus]|nr:Chaperone protein dnaJ 11 [Spatholobus suberectus]
MITATFPTPTATFSCKRVPSPPRHVRFRSIVSFATATKEQQRHRPPSYLSPHSMASCTTLYEILGICAAASFEEIKAAYRRLARVCHPDVAPVDRKESSAGEFMKIHAAYCTLSDPEKRASYDRSLFRHQPPLTTTPSRSSGYSGRNWETDQCW